MSQTDFNDRAKGIGREQLGREIKSDLKALELYCGDSPSEDDLLGEYLPEIYHKPGQLSLVLDGIVSALRGRGVYVWSGGLYRVHVLTADENGVIHRPSGAVLLHRIDAAHLAELATKFAQHYKYDARSGDYRLIDCPRRMAEAVISRGYWPELPQLHGVIESPTITPDGTLIDRPGYHLSGIFLTSCPDGYSRPNNFSREAASKAVEVLREGFGTFPFVDQADHDAAVASVLTAIMRRSLSAAPMIAITAPTPGTGKSLLAEAISTIVLGRSPAMLALGDDEAETEKRLYSALLAGDSLLVADNIEAPIKGALLCQMLTQSSVQFRPLGVSAMVTVPTQTTLVATGNNLAIIGDLRRRVMLVRLDARTERPEHRKFNRDAIGYVAHRRGELIRAALTITLSYLADGSPNIQGLSSYGGFSDWDLFVRRPLVWAGFSDPLTPADCLRDTDPDLETTRALFAAWRAAFGSSPTTVQEAIGKARESYPRFDGGSESVDGDLRDAIQSAAGDKLDSRRLGGWLRRHKDRVIDGMRLQQATVDSHAKVARWYIQDAV